jgi:hypothetical protein
VTICDIEGAWNLNHEDLPAGIKLIGGTMINDLGWRNHGTAVLGEMVSVRGNVGCVGISHEAKAIVHSAVINGVFNPAGAITAAAVALKPGDVILIELHGTAPIVVRGKLAKDFADKKGKLRVTGKLLLGEKNVLVIDAEKIEVVEKTSGTTGTK